VKRNWRRLRPLVVTLLTAIVIGVTLPRVIGWDSAGEAVASVLLVVVAGYLLWRLHHPRPPADTIPPAKPVRPRRSG
jgi:uncharacterized membrane protein YfcA